MPQAKPVETMNPLFKIPCNGILCRYSEIAIKGRNRAYFEKLLIENLHYQLSDITAFKAVRERGRIFLLPKGDGNSFFPPSDLNTLHLCIERVFGISSVSPALKITLDLETIEQTVEEYFPLAYECLTKKKKDGEIRYAMRARRSNRRYPMNSHELELHFANKLLPAYPRLQVDLENPELLIQLEVRDEAAFLSFLNLPGPGGMPIGSAGRNLVMLSGGIDSPVAAYMMMRRGCRLDFITFHSAPYTPPATLSKTAALVRRLNEFQKTGRLFCVNLLPAQKAVRDKCNPRYRTVLYRRLMIRIACRIAAENNILSLTTGDNLGQVASQTMENLSVINHVADRPVFRPLLTNDKQDTVSVARNIKTYEISRREAPDSCTVFAPDNPATKTRSGKIAQEEAKIDIDSLINACLRESTLMDTLTEEEKPISSNF